jgi:hypothetical protein
LESSEFLVVLFTSSLTLSISGIFKVNWINHFKYRRELNHSYFFILKEVCVIYLAVVINHNKLNYMNTIGLCVCLLGIVVHVFMKAKHQAELIKSKIFWMPILKLSFRNKIINNIEFFKKQIIQNHQDTFILNIVYNTMQNYQKPY